MGEQRKRLVVSRTVAVTSDGQTITETASVEIDPDEYDDYPNKVVEFYLELLAQHLGTPLVSAAPVAPSSTPDSAPEPQVIRVSN